MPDERVESLEAAFVRLSESVEAYSGRRDQQLGALATELAGIKAGITDYERRVGVVEVAVRPPSLASVWGPAAASVGLIATLGGSFLNMTQREQDAKLEIVESHVKSTDSALKLLREDARFLDEQIRIDERDFRGALAGVTARMTSLEQKVEDIDLHGSRK